LGHGFLLCGHTNQASAGTWGMARMTPPWGNGLDGRLEKEVGVIEVGF
jgi:hypothetical protein